MNSKSRDAPATGGATAAAAATSRSPKPITPHQRGTIIMKTVSMFLASGRRVSNQNRQSATGKHQGQPSSSAKVAKPVRRPRMEDPSGKLNPKMLDMLKKKTHFTRNEIEALCRIYKKLVSNCQFTSRALAVNTPSSVIAKPHASVEGIDRIVFRELLHSTFDIVTEETIMERIFTNWDKGHEGLPIRLEGWVTGLSVFLRGSPAEKAAFCFRIYDLNADGFIAKDEMFTLLRNCLIKQPQDEDPDEGVKDFVEVVLKKFDVDKDGKVSFSDFCNTVGEEPLLMEAFGQCLPTDTAIQSFIATLQIQMNF